MISVPSPPAAAAGALAAGSAPPRRRSMRPDARDQLARRERLGDVVVGARLQPGDAVDLVAARRQQDNRHLALAPDATADLQAVHLRHQHVQDDQVRAVGLETAQAEQAVVGDGHREPLVAQRGGEHGGEAPIVVHDEHAANHRTSLTLRRSPLG